MPFTRVLLTLLLALSCWAQPAAADAKAQKALSAAAGAPPAVTLINGSPLTIHVGADFSFQVFNSTVPGQGQIFPSGTAPTGATADMGWFVRSAGTLFAPDFSAHESGTATGGIGVNTPFSAIAVSAVSGSGSSANPFRVTVTGTAGASGLTVSQQVEYVNGENFFRKNFTLTNAGSASLTPTVILGGDIFLAAADSGRTFREAQSGSPGGQDCASPPTYTILYIPLTPADRYTGAFYNTVWTQIGAGQLDNALAPGCIDNGAALQWNRSLAAGQGVTLQAATSFGQIPGIAQFNVSAVNPASGAQGATLPVTISGFGFEAATTFTFGPGITVSNVVVSGPNSATATLVISAAASVGPRDVVGTQRPAGLTSTLFAGFQVSGAGGGQNPSGPTVVSSLSATGLGLLALSLLLMGFIAVRRFH